MNNKKTFMIWFSDIGMINNSDIFSNYRKTSEINNYLDFDNKHEFSKLINV